MYNLAYEMQVAELVNEERERAGIPPLVFSQDLSHVARIKSRDMLVNNYFSHQSPTFGSPFDMLTSFGIRYTAAAENIAMGQRTPEAVMNSWMRSPGHRQNILNAGFTDLGVGFAEDAQGNTYWTQLFVTR